MTNKGIVIGTSDKTEPFLNDMLKSLDVEYPIYKCVEGVDRPNQSFELGAISCATKRFDEFIFLHDTTVIKDNSLFDKLFAINGHVALTDGFFHYFGKFVSKDMPPIPEVKDKEDAIYWETRWFTKPYSVFSPHLPQFSERREFRHGRENMVCENDYLIKYKATFR